MAKCKICGKDFDDDGGRSQICDVCRGTAAVKRNCRHCGAPVEPWQQGAAMVKWVCRACFIKRVKTNLTRNDTHRLVIHFRKTNLRDKIIPWLMEEADRNVRTIDDQVVFILLERMREAENER